MTIESHSIVSGGNHKGRKENAKENGICKKLSDEEYEREKAKIKVHLEVMMELLQKEEEDQRCGFHVKRKLKWHKLQRRREQLINAQCEEDVLKTSGRLGEVLKTEASRESKRSQCLETNILCVSIGTNNEEGQYANIVIEDEGRGKNLNSVMGEDEIVESHVHAHTQLSESNGFQLIMQA